MEAPPTSSKLSAAVLAGGLSRRMGRDKALFPLRADDPPLAAMVIARAQLVADEVFVVARDRPAYEAFGVPVVPDIDPDDGTLGGIATALHAAANEYCLVLACDLPFLNPALLRWLAAHPRDYDALVPRLPGESRQGGGAVFQTLHAIYAKRCLPAIERRLAAGRRQIVGFFDDVNLRPVDADVIAEFDPNFRSFFNANTPEAAEEARALLERLPIRD